MIKNKWQIVLFLVFLFLPLNSWSQSSTEKTLKTITVQVASLKEIEKTEQELARLKSHGIDPFMRHEHVRDKGMWYRIYVGRFKTRGEATKFAQDIKDQGIISGFWVKQIEIPGDPVKSSQTIVDQPDKPEMNVDMGHDKPAPPPVVIEIPRAVTPTEEKLSPSQPPARKPIDQKPPLSQLPAKEPIGQKPSRSQPPPEKPKAIIPGKAQEPAATGEKKTEEILPAQDSREKEPTSPPQGIAVQGPDKQAENDRFSIGVKSSYFLASNAEDFIIKRTTGGVQYAWSFKNAKVYNSLISSYQFNPTISIEAAIERAFFTKLDIWHLNMGPKVAFRKIGMLTPYAKGSLVLGHLEWDDVPGDFDTAWGWEGGLGALITKSNIQFGLEASYRAIKYDYNRPSDADVTATDSQLDFSGYALSATLHYRF